MRTRLQELALRAIKNSLAARFGVEKSPERRCFIDAEAIDEDLGIEGHLCSGLRIFRADITGKGHLQLGGFQPAAGSDPGDVVARRPLHRILGCGNQARMNEVDRDDDKCCADREQSEPF